MFLSSGFTSARIVTAPDPISIPTTCVGLVGVSRKQIRRCFASAHWVKRAPSARSSAVTWPAAGDHAYSVWSVEVRASMFQNTTRRPSPLHQSEPIYLPEHSAAMHVIGWDPSGDSDAVTRTGGTPDASLSPSRASHAKAPLELSIGGVSAPFPILRISTPFRPM